MEFSRREYWSRLPCPPPGDLPNPGIEPVSLMSLGVAGGFFTSSATVAPLVKNLPAMQIQLLVWEDPLEEEMATHSSILAWEIPWAEEPGRL